MGPFPSNTFTYPQNGFTKNESYPDYNVLTSPLRLPINFTLYGNRSLLWFHLA